MYMEVYITNFASDQAYHYTTNQFYEIIYQLLKFYEAA